MVYFVNNLREVNQKLRDYISDERPLNLAEMQNILTVLGNLQSVSAQLSGSVDERQFPSWLKIVWHKFKESCGFPLF